MAEPTLALTYGDMIIRVAEHLGIASYADDVAAVPTDAHDLEVCKRIVNDGWRRFYNSNPQWNWTDRVFEITFDSEGTSDRIVNGETWRYYMPDGFYGHTIGPFTYAENSGILQIEEAREDAIRSMRASAESSGHPSYYAIRPLAGDNKRKWELIVWPDPSSDKVITGRCRIYPNELIELTDTHNAGFQFDEAVLAACLAEAERQKEDSNSLLESQWAESLVRAVAIDQKTAPRRLGDYGNKGRRAAARSYTGVDSYTNLDGTVHDF